MTETMFLVSTITGTETWNGQNFWAETKTERNLILGEIVLAPIRIQKLDLDFSSRCTVNIKRVTTVYENYNVIAFKSCIQMFTVYTNWDLVTDYMVCCIKEFMSLQKYITAPIVQPTLKYNLLILITHLEQSWIQPCKGLVSSTF